MAKGPKFQFWRGLRANLPALDDGEACWTTDTHEFFIGQDGVNYLVSGAGAAIADGVYGDVTVSLSGTVWTVDASLFDAAGAAAAAVLTHEGLSDPHPQYLTTTEADGSYAAISHAHSAADITSGELAMARGGTGQSLSDPGADRLLGWDDGTNQVGWISPGGVPITILSGNTLGFVNSTYGDITVSSDGAVWTIANEAVTYAKMQNLSGTSLLLGRGTSGAGSPQEISLGHSLYMADETLNGPRAELIAKVVAVITFPGGTPTLDTDHSYEVASLTSHASGDLTINFSKEFTSASYGVLLSIEADSSNLYLVPMVKNGGKAVGSVRVAIWQFNFGSFGNPESLTVVCFGEQ